MNKMKAFVIGVFVWAIAMTVINIISAADVIWTKYRFENNLSGVTCPTSNYIFVRDSVPDFMTCSKICFTCNKCLTFVFLPEIFQCTGCEVIGFNGPLRLSESIQFSRRDYNIDCKDILDRNKHAVSGVYKIRTLSSETINVYCDMKTDGGGWTILQSRINGEVSFNRDFSEYEKGFGTVADEDWVGTVKNEFWLGLRYIQELTNFPSELRLSVVTSTDIAGFEMYTNFELLGSTYKLSVDEQPKESEMSTITESPLLVDLNLVPFRTYDKDSASNCARFSEGGWWYPDDLNCINYNLNSGEWTGLRKYDPVKNSSLMVRRM